MGGGRGGNFIDGCIEPDSVYEVLDPSLEIVIKQMLNLPPEADPIIVSVPVLILSYIVSRQPVKQITIWGVSLFFDQFKAVGVKAAIGVVIASPFFIFPVGLVSLTSAVLAGAIAVNVVQEITDFECDKLLSKVPVERVSEGKTVGFLERPPENNPKVFIKNNENIELYFPSLNDNGFCSSEYNQVEGKKSNLMGVKTEPQTQMNRICEKEYIPLKERTKTLSDLKKHDSTANREKAGAYIKRYEERRKRIMNKRINEEL